NKEEQHHIFGKGFPWRKFYGITKTTAIRDLVEIGGIKGEEGEKNDHKEQVPDGETGLIPHQKHNAQHHLKYYQKKGDGEGIWNEERQVEHPCTEILLQLE